MKRQICLQTKLRIKRADVGAVAGGVAHHIMQRGVDHPRLFFTDSDRRTLFA
jgi:hypothetical protein